MSQRKLDGLLKGLLLIWVFLTLLLITTLTAAQPENSPGKSGSQHFRVTFRSVQLSLSNATPKA
ncbi:MAG TPA: hypothetical protein VGG46_03315 [Terriglobales bacterium]|jgi:hypothetical protein